MRRFLLAAVMFGMAAGAQAADLSDLPILRGGLHRRADQPSVNWQGFYVGGQAGTASDMNFTGFDRAASPRHLLTGTAIEAAATSRNGRSWARSRVHGTGYGGFVGYNSQWDDVVLGVEANYMHGNVRRLADRLAMCAYLHRCDGSTD